MRILASNLNERPHFMLTIAPASKRPVYRSVPDCVAAISRAAVTSSVQTLPHFDASGIKPGPLNAYADFTSSSDPNDAGAEEWRCHRSGEFRLRSGFWEIIDADAQDRMNRHTVFVSKAGMEPIAWYINIVGLVYRVTAAYVFAAKLFTAFEHVDSAEIMVGLGGMQGCALGRVDDLQRFARAPIARTPSIEHRTSISLSAVPPNAYDLAADALVDLVRGCGWETNRAMFASWQDDLRRSIARG